MQIHLHTILTKQVGKERLTETAPYDSTSGPSAVSPGEASTSFYHTLLTGLVSHSEPRVRSNQAESLVAGAGVDDA